MNFCGVCIGSSSLKWLVTIWISASNNYKYIIPQKNTNEKDFEKSEKFSKQIKNSGEILVVFPNNFAQNLRWQLSSLYNVYTNAKNFAVETIIYCGRPP